MNESRGQVITKTMGYVYYLGGQLEYLWYPSGDRMVNEVTAAGRTYGVIDETNNYVFGNAMFTPSGALSGMSQFSRSGSYTGYVSVNFFYNQRLQPELTYASNGTFFYQHCYDFHLKGGMNISAGGATCSSSVTSPGNNGNVYQITNNLNTARTQNFVYDSLNRINQAYTSGSTWGQQLNIDAWGNLSSVMGLTGYPLVGGFTSTTPVPVTNHLTGTQYSYDAAGNMTSAGNGGMTYDAENRIITASGVNYTYDGDGKRVEKSNGTLYWTGVGTDALSESDLSGNINEEYVFFNGIRVSKIDRPSDTVHAFFTDHLGSSRMSVVASGSNTLLVEDDLDYTPHGVVAYGTPTDHYEFTGKERDSESGLDNFWFRYYGSSLGRFMKPDNGAAQDPANPQGWNLYSYVMNQATVATDFDGHDCIYQNPDSGQITGFNRGDCDNSTEEKANSGIYIEGTVNPGATYDPNTQTLNFTYTPYEGGAGVGAITGVPATPALFAKDSGAVSPGMLGPGDLILFSGVKTPSFVTDVLGKVLGSIFGKTVEGAGAGVEEIVTKAGSSIGNQSIKASSRATAEEAAEAWVGAGARPILREGEQVGFVSADGTKVARWTSAGKPDPYINLTNNTTGGNLHVHF